MHDWLVTLQLNHVNKSVLQAVELEQLEGYRVSSGGTGSHSTVTAVAKLGDLLATPYSNSRMETTLFLTTSPILGARKQSNTVGFDLMTGRLSTQTSRRPTFVEKT